jgi:hypothetical protein
LKDLNEGGVVLVLLDVLEHAERFLPRPTARCIYDAKGFVLAEQRDGAQNDFKEPDALYPWTRD